MNQDRPVFKKGNLPLFVQLYLHLKEEIISQEIPAGSKLPTIIELHKMFKLSQGTVNRALDLLEQEGLVERKSGLGIYARKAQKKPSSAKGKLPIENIDDMVFGFNCDLLEQGWVEPPFRVRQLVEDQKAALNGERIYFVKFLQENKELSHHPTIMEMYISAMLAKRLDPKEIEAQGVYRVIAPYSRKERFAVRRVRQLIKPWVTNNESSRLMGVSAGTPLLQRFWTFYNLYDELVIYAESLVIPHTGIVTEGRLDPLNPEGVLQLGDLGLRADIVDRLDPQGG